MEKAAKWDFFKRCVCCNGKLAPSDGHSLCLFCLSKGYNIGTCQHCAKFLKQTGWNREACLHHLLLLSASQPLDTKSQSLVVVFSVAASSAMSLAQVSQGATALVSTSASARLASTRPTSMASALAASSVLGSAVEMADKSQGHKSDNLNPQSPNQISNRKTKSSRSFPNSIRSKSHHLQLLPRQKWLHPGTSCCQTPWNCRFMSPHQGYHVPPHDGRREVSVGCLYCVFGITR